MSKYVFPKALKELRIHFSQSGPGSETIKTFLTKTYPALKKNNPNTPILIREALGIKPVAYARFEYGQEAKADLSNASDVATTLKELIERR
ncbi:NADH-ubiquinone oxidoreductase 10 subunit [Wickerhamiella sorbophila]|uniref:NADH-ubiquinone oxidoreductase 10 subunit n=1 Tax=Wickerhamiella sorbophila TaxID=45607 RepID=A0A2T0FLB0_9ASCO|nr:NADH-ubiquinone oxidoreductase 10 subunit [Wickerhamiella sorbophila]PRT55765.1 NADH-ubiquinone oxidoreductase 10 subunit [Wickerhamiella sorbophila]